MRVMDDDPSLLSTGSKEIKCTVGPSNKKKKKRVGMDQYRAVDSIPYVAV